ncbi:MAG: DUF1800 family protein [Luteolibacter sp.]
MSIYVQPPRACRARHFLALTGGFLSLILPARAQVDMEINKEVWKQKYGVLTPQMNEQSPYAGWLSQDADGDGVNNRSEFLAGTNPFQKSPGEVHFHPPAVDQTPTTLTLTFPTQPGKFYTTESSTNLVDAWSHGALPSITGDGNPRTLVVPKSAGNFFHIGVSDQATQGDQVSDWAKNLLGLSMAAPIQGQTSYDHTSLVSTLQAENRVSLNVLDTAATQPADSTAFADDPAVIRVSRSGAILLGNVIVPIVKSGTAVESIDYAPLPGSVTFPAGVNAIDLKITPLFNAGRATSCSVTLAAQDPGSANASGSYTLGTPATASATIHPSGNPTGTGLTANYFVGANSTYASNVNFGGNAATYTYTKATATTGSAVITYTGTTGFTTTAPNNRVNLKFPTGSLAGGTYDGVATITAVSGNTLTAAVGGTAVPNSQTGSANCLLNPPVVTRLDPSVAFSWLYGTPNGAQYTAADNYSVAWEGYLSPSSAGSYVFQLDADDKARVFLDLNDGNGLLQILENGWPTAATGTYKPSTPFALAIPAAPANRYHMRVEFVETTGNAKCRFQWKLNTGSFGNISSANVFTNNTGTTAGWAATYYNNTTLAAPAAGSRTDTAITNGNNGDWGAGSPDPTIYHDFFCSRWTGQILPQYSETCSIVVNADDAAKLWINGQPQTLRRLASDNPSVTYNYTQNSTTNGTIVLTYSSAPFSVGDVIPLKFTSGTLSAAFGTTVPYTVTATTSTTFTVALSGTGLPASDLTNSSKCTIDTTDLTVAWPTQTSVDRYCNIPLLAGVLYDIKLETCEFTAAAGTTLSWFGPSQTKQVIPTSRLFPTMTGTASRPGDPPAAPPAITSDTEVTTLLNSGSPFTLTLTASNGAGNFTATGLPAWLTLTNGILSGTPPAAGVYQFTVTTSNSAGSGSAVITVEVLDTGNQLTRELWTTGVTGPSLANVPWTNPPSSSNTITSAQDGTTTYGANTGERLRGYFTAPVTGNYYFWIAASNAAELWISNNAEPVNKVRRASATDTPPGTWNAQASQKSQWLSLTAGEKYYIEALHNTGVNPAANHLSVAWFLDPTGTTANPITNGCPPAAATTGGILPGYALSPWDNPPTTTVPGTIYVTNLQGVDGLSGITATGGAFLRVNGNAAVIQLHHNGLSSGITSRRIVKGSATTLFDLTGQDRNYPALKTTDGGYTWNMGTSDLADLENGLIRIVISTTNHPTGEISGTFGKTAGSQTAPAVPSYPAWSDLHATSDADNSRFLTQATFGPSLTDMADVKNTGYRAWIDNQFIATPTKNVPYILDNLSADPQNPYGSTLMINSWWKNSVTAPDQLRQRAAFALSEILVVSDTGPLNNNGRVLADYYDNLLDTCFGNFRDILKQVTLSPAMGVYLDMRANAKGDVPTGLHPNENYAREVLQLFSAGLYRVWPDGTLLLDSSGNAIATYDQEVITGMARVFTGWNWGQPMAGGRLPSGFSPASNYLDPMVLVPARHELGSKILLDNVVLPPATTVLSGDASSDPSSTYAVQSTDPVLGAGNLVTTTITNKYDLNGAKDLEKTLDNILENSATGPYICRQLIQRLITSHPKPEYVHRVVRAFNGEQNVDGAATGIRGDMKEVFRAILLDAEARGTTAAADPKFGKQREPLLRITGPARAFPAPGFANSTYSQTATGTILVTTPIPHKLINGSVRLSGFVDSGGSSSQVPTTQTYSISNVTANSFTVNNTGTSSSLDYIISGNTAVISSPGFASGDDVFVNFTTGALVGSTYSKQYSVFSATGSTFTITLSPSPGTGTDGTTGTCLIPKLTAGYNVTGSAGAQTITIQTSGNHNLVAGTDSVALKFVTLNSPVAAADGTYQVTSVVGPNSFKVTAPPTPTLTNGSQGGNSVNVFPLKGTHWTRSGTCSVELSTWGIGYTSSNLNQTPLNSTTVFNFFYPDYQYPGPMAKAGMTTPEFQLTNDSNTMNLTNVITQGAYTNFSGATNGYGSFFSGNAIAMDITPYMTYAQTNNTGVPTLIDTLGVLLTGGNLSPTVKDTINAYVTNTSNITYSAPTPTSAQMRDRVRSIVHLITISSEYAIQK